MALLLMGMGSVDAATLKVDFAAAPDDGDGASIFFDPTDTGGGVGTFTFESAATGYDFAITGASPTPFLSSAIGLFGEITGVYEVGPITTTGDIQTADVTPTGGGPFEFRIDDGAGDTFVGTVDWIDIATFGAFGGLNSDASVNLTGVTYTGTNAALLALAAAEDHSVVISFQFTPPRSLHDIFDATVSSSTSYSGSLTSETDQPIPEIPEPASLVLLLGSTLCVGGFASRRRLRKTTSVA
jgi:hypothetical protein